MVAAPLGGGAAEQKDLASDQTLEHLCALHCAIYCISQRTREMNMIKPRSPQFPHSFQRIADTGVVLAFALGIALSLAVSAEGAKDDDGDRHPLQLLKCDDTLKDEFRP